MAGKKGMPRYSEEIKSQIYTEHQKGKSVKSLSKKYGISRYAIQSWCGLRAEVNLRKQTPLPRGRKAKNPESLDQEVKRLRMENAMMRDFLKEYGRR